MTGINHIVVQGVGLVSYRVILPDGSSREFDDLDEAIAGAGEHDATDFQLLFPDGTESTVGRVSPAPQRGEDTVILKEKKSHSAP